MFWRLFATYVLFLGAALFAVVVLLLQRASDLFSALFWELLVAVLIILTLAIPTAYYLALLFTRSLDQLAEAARRISEGEFRKDIEITGSREIVTLAQTLNTMRSRLALLITELEDDKDQLQTILSGMDEGVIAFDADQKILFINQRAMALLGYRGSEPVGQHLNEILTQQDMRSVVERGLKSEGPYRESVDLKDSQETTLSLYITRLPSSKTPSMVIVIDDITERSRFERLRQDFVANVSHELKTPLTNIRSSVEVLIDGAAEDPATRSLFLSQIDEQATRLYALVIDLLNLAKMEAGNFTIELEAVSVEDAVHTCLDRHRTRAEAKGQSLHGVALAGCPPTLAVWANDEALAQILDNLVDNAIKYTNKDGRITVRWTATEQQVLIEVEDTGLGIPEEKLPRVFERFFRIDKARSREMGGTGLGLAIVKHMVQALHGTVRVSSVVNQGTTFSVSLPRGAHLKQ